MNYLLDTNVIFELVAKQPFPDVVNWIDQLDPYVVYLSVMTIGEIRKGIAKLPASKRRESLERWLLEDLLVRFHDHILPLDINVLLAWGQLTGELAAKGINLPAIDSLIAATVLHYHYTLVTRNEADFQHTGITVANPWKQYH